MLIPKHEYIRDTKHRRYIANLPCVVCNKPDVQAAHIRSGNKAGMGLKSSDLCCVPLCCGCHSEQSSMSERAFWKDYGGIDKAIELARDLFNVTGDTIEGMKRISEWRQ